MAFADMRGRTGFRVLTGNRKHVLVDVVVMKMVHVPVVKKVGMAVVLNLGMATGVMVHVGVWCMREVTHCSLL